MDSRISAVVCFIGKRPAADMDTLATAVNLSPSRLRHLFRLEMATALHAYLNTTLSDSMIRTRRSKTSYLY
jgi:AraC-like DNA-binding protein